MRHLSEAQRLLLLILVLAVLPVVDTLFSWNLHFSDILRPIFIFMILGLGMNVVTGYTGLLQLGVAAFMAIGAYSYAIFTCSIYPFQVGFWLGCLITLGIGGIAGLCLGFPTLRLRGDYLAIVTLGFGEIVQDTLKNLEGITKGTQGINPVPYPSFFGYAFAANSTSAWYYLLLATVTLLVLASYSLEHSRIGRGWIAIREDEIAASCLGVKNAKAKLLAFVICAMWSSLAGALWAASLGSSGEPGNYDFQISVIALCIIIVGGLGSLTGVLVGSLLMVGMNSVVLVKLSDWFARQGLSDGVTVWSVPNNWKYAAFGLALVLMTRFRPQGIFSEGK